MKWPSPLILAIVGLSKLSALGDQAGLSDHAGPLDNWPQWRGPLANRLAPRGIPPAHQRGTHNVRWQISLPGKGRSPSIVFGDRGWVLSAVRVGSAPRPVDRVA